MRSRAVKKRDYPVPLRWLSAVGEITAPLSQGDMLGAGSLECLCRRWWWWDKPKAARFHRVQLRS